MRTAMRRRPAGRMHSLMGIIPVIRESDAHGDGGTAQPERSAVVFMLLCVWVFVRVGFFSFAVFNQTETYGGVGRKHDMWVCIGPHLLCTLFLNCVGSSRTELARPKCTHWDYVYREHTSHSRIIVKRNTTLRIVRREAGLELILGCRQIKCRSCIVFEANQIDASTLCGCSNVRTRPISSWKRVP